MHMEDGGEMMSGRDSKESKLFIYCFTTLRFQRNLNEVPLIRALTKMMKLIQSILILIAVLMSTTWAQEVIYAQVGETVRLKATGITQYDYIYWYFGDKNGPQIAWLNKFGGRGFDQWKDRLSWFDDTLIITNIQPDNFGTYICKAKSGTNNPKTIETFTLLKLNVSLEPNSPLLPRESLTLTCDVEAPQGHKPQIYWLNPQGTKVESKEGKVTKNATIQDNGQWTCVLTNNGNQKEVVVSVTVVDLSPAPSDDHYISKSSSFTIPCSILPHITWKQIKEKNLQAVYWNFLPKPSSGHISKEQKLFSLSVENLLEWKRSDQDKRLRPVPRPDGGNLSLIINEVQTKDKGNYTCGLVFKNGVTLSRSIKVDVLEIISSPGTELMCGQQVSLTCSIGRALPSDVKLKWVPPPETSLQALRSDHHPANLTILEVGKGDGGKWRCELWRNDIRLTSAIITLKIESIFSVWMLVTVCGATVIVILICILVLILYRRRQRKMRHLSYRLCQCKNPKPKGFYRT
ncbi:hypothetical protein PAMP_002937 [Pampus punctatissimus]